MTARVSDPTIVSKVQFPGQDGTALVVQTGGQIHLESGAKLYENGNDVTPVVAVVGGEVALDGSNPTPVATGLTSITSVALTLRKNSAPGVGTDIVTYDTTGGTLNIYGWKPTASGDDTLIASTGTETVGYVVTGIR